MLIDLPILLRVLLKDVLSLGASPHLEDESQSDYKTCLIFYEPFDLLNILASEEIDDTLPHVLVDEDVQDRVDEAVEVSENHHVPDPFPWDVVLAATLQHEEDGVGPPADQEGDGDDSHDKGDPSEMLVILPNKLVR